MNTVRYSLQVIDSLPSQMPVCSFFLRGVCTRDDCPYVHVSVGRDAEVCQDFLHGYCPSGERVCVESSSDINTAFP